ncbi:MAG: ISAzo13 family transposase [Candidatus Bathyarchaeota archaeon]|uniref:ISAzo13 family transposase n=1 Tax=Candidatus Bathycorpusculum sp. TaxID=2994959 RepID=UPI002819E131|nr:ISAzo13 family transposase [Candidatus Termiticorpusculum sp.]MCL2256632.1 ISAzo13 family transposase [Candidatus Termiticorpusculum sp.]MCL2293189.1 ISAzo13 family transposase [Candidatus Termiticorpusculum sp.]
MDDAAKTRIQRVFPLLNERQRRLYLAAEVESLGHGGLKAVHELTGVSKSTLLLGEKELREGVTHLEVDKARKAGGGRSLVTQKYKDLTTVLENVMEPSNVDDSERVLWWTTKSLRTMEEVLSKKGFKISHNAIGNLLNVMGYSLRQNQKMRYFSGPRPDVFAQFLFIVKKCCSFIGEGCPVVSVVTDKKELLGDFRKSLVECGKGVSGQSLVSEFPLETLGKVDFSDVYEVTGRLGFVNLGVLSGDEVGFEVESLLRWWQTLGCHIFRGVKKLYVISDDGGCDGLRFGLWQRQLQELANLTGLEIHVSYFPPGTSKWHVVGYEMFCFTSNGGVGVEGDLGVSVEAGVKLILNMVALKRLKIICVKNCEKVVLRLNVAGDEGLSGVNLVRDEFYGDWNYVISPK